MSGIVPLTREEVLELIGAGPQHVHGGMFANGEVTPTFIASSGTWTKGICATHGLASPPLERMTATANRLTYTGTGTCHLNVRGVCSIIDGNNKNIAVGIAKNGTVESGMWTLQHTNNTGKALGIPLVADYELSTGDYIELWLRNDTDASNLTISDVLIIADGLVSL
jgi:hypothetical protein